MWNISIRCPTIRDYYTLCLSRTNGAREKEVAPSTRDQWAAFLVIIEAFLWRQRVGESKYGEMINCISDIYVVAYFFRVFMVKFTIIIFILFGNERAAGFDCLINLYKIFISRTKQV